MKVFKDGVWYDEKDVLVLRLSEEEQLEEELTYAEKVVNEIRTVYSVDDELAILRQRYTKPDEFDAYFQFVENVKSKYKGE